MNSVLKKIAAEARTLSDLLSARSQVRESEIEVNRSEAKIGRWFQSVAEEDAEQFEKRLKWDNIDQHSGQFQAAMMP